MQEVIEKLLILQDRDQRILRTKDQLARIEPERQALQARVAATQAGMDAAKTKLKQVETDRKKLELEAESKKQQIERYSLQQFETKKNEEYRALAHEIDTCKGKITELEDQQLTLMEQAESLQKQAAGASREADEARKLAQDQLKELADREQSLRGELAELESNRDQLTDAIEERALRHYERILRNKGDNVVVGIQHGVCGGCHMKFPVQLMVTCQAAKDLVTCPNCGRILYYTPDMDLAVAE
ncbi:MAG: C4-type zinc ribbon domain-containing protein [Verrucomicrobiota bacterium]|jgi:predicted  nucleic acid-binding Zn-ribbon protein